LLLTEYLSIDDFQCNFSHKDGPLNNHFVLFELEYDPKKEILVILSLKYGSLW
jgi:hypothetical protein